MRSPSYRVAKVVSAAIAVALVAEAFYLFYPRRELVAALVIFAVAFSAAGMVVLSLFSIREAALKGVARVAYARVHHTRSDHRE